MYQQMNNNYPFNNGYGFSYAARPMPKYTQPVTAEMYKMLNQQGDELDIRISNIDKIKNWCTHKEPGSGRMALVENPADGTVTCRVCGETFRIVDDTEEEVEKAANHIVDILQTIKATYVDIPEEFLKQYSQTKSMVELIPKLYKRANKNFAMYEAYTGQTVPSNPGFNTFAAMNGILNGGYPMMSGYPQAPMGPMMGGYPQAWPMNPQGQMVNPGAPWTAQQPAPNAGMQNPAAAPMQGWGVPPQVAPTVPYIDQQGNVMPTAPNGVNTMGGNPMMGGFNPLMATGAPGSMSAPMPTGPAVATPAAAPAGTEPTQTKQMTV